MEKYAYFRKEVLKYIVLDFKNLFLEFGFWFLVMGFKFVKSCD